MTLYEIKTYYELDEMFGDYPEKTEEELSQRALLSVMREIKDGERKSKAFIIKECFGVTLEASKVEEFIPSPFAYEQTELEEFL